MLYPIILLDILQEVSNSPCDTGSSKEKLLEEFGDHDLDLDGVRDDWTNKGKGSVFEPTVEALTARAKEARRKLKEIAEVMEGDIAVVTHGGFLHFLTDDWEGIPSGKGMSIFFIAAQFHTPPLLLKTQSFFSFLEPNPPLLLLSKAMSEANRNWLSLSP